MKLLKVVFLHLCSPRGGQNQAKVQPQPRIPMEKCVLLWLGREESEPLSWTAAEFKDHEITWNVISGSQIISLLAFWLMIKEDKVTPKYWSTSHIPLNYLQNSLYRSISQFCSLLPHFTAWPVTHFYSWAHKGPGFTLSNHTTHAADALTHSIQSKEIHNKLIQVINQLEQERMKIKTRVLDQQCPFFPHSWSRTGVTSRGAGTELCASAEPCRDGIPARRFQYSSLGHMSEQVCSCGTRRIPSYQLTHTDLCSSSALCPTKTLGAFIKHAKAIMVKNKTKVINTAWMSNLPLFLFRAGISACKKFSLPL